MNYIGIDIGDGESCVCVLAESSDIEPRPVPLSGRKSFLSAVALDNSGNVLIGQDAVRETASRELAVRFKSRFLAGDPADETSMQRFLRGICDELRKQQLLTDRDRVVIGCPAGWKQSARERYLGLIRQAGYPNPRLVSESRAAFMYAKHARTIQLDADLVNESALVIDIGSSTLDFAYVVNGRETNVGIFGDVYLGGGAIDEALLSAAVDASPKKADVLATFADAPQWRSFCLLTARQIKEEYFTLQSQGQKNIQCRDTVMLLYDEPIQLSLQVNDQMIWRVVNLKIAALDGSSFFGMLKNALQEARRQTEARPPRLVLLTGGASRMKFFEEQCREAFPDSHFVLCEEPEFSIAKGLAYSAKVDDGILAFNQAIDQYLREDHIRGAVQGRLSTLVDSVAVCVADVAYAQARANVEQWQQGKFVTLNEMNKAISHSVEQAMASEQAKGMMRAVIRDKIEAVCLDLQSDINDICRRYGVAASQMDLSGVAEAMDQPVSADFAVNGDMSFLCKALQTAITAVTAGVMLLIPGGQIIDLAVIVVAAFAVVLGRDYIGQMTGTVNIPVRLRSLISVDKIVNESTRTKLLDGIKIGLAKNDALWNGVSRDIEQNIAAYVSRMAQKTEIAITTDD